MKSRIFHIWGEKTRSFSDSRISNVEPRADVLGAAFVLWISNYIAAFLFGDF